MVISVQRLVAFRTERNQVLSLGSALTPPTGLDSHTPADTKQQRMPLLTSDLQMTRCSRSVTLGGVLPSPGGHILGHKIREHFQANTFRATRSAPGI